MSAADKHTNIAEFLLADQPKVRDGTLTFTEFAAITQKTAAATAPPRQTMMDDQGNYLGLPGGGLSFLTVVTGLPLMEDDNFCRWRCICVDGGCRKLDLKCQVLCLKCDF